MDPGRDGIASQLAKTRRDLRLSLYTLVGGLLVISVAVALEMTGRSDTALAPGAYLSLITVILYNGGGTAALAGALFAFHNWQILERAQTIVAP